MSTFDSTNANSILKERYAEKIGDLVPDNALISKRVDFKQMQATGRYFYYPIQPTMEQGFTYGGSGATAYTLNTPISGVVQDAQIPSYEMTNRAHIAKGIIEKSNTDVKAFENALNNRVKNLVKSHHKRQEIAFRYGQTGLGVTASQATAGAGSSLVTLTAASWAGGIWAGMESAQIEFWDAGGTKFGTGIFTIASIDFENKTITVDEITAGDAALLDAEAAPLDIYFAGARTGASTFNEMIGIDSIMTTTTGSIFNVSVDDYRLWKGNTYANGGVALSLLKITKALNVPQNLGLDGDRILVLCSPTAWADLANDEAALRRYTNVSKEAKNGFDHLEFNYSGNTLEVIGDPLVKEGEAFMFPLSVTKRVGACDVKMDELGGSGKYIDWIPNQNGYEIRSYSNQEIFFDKPAVTVKITGIVPT